MTHNGIILAISALFPAGALDVSMLTILRALSEWNSDTKSGCDHPSPACSFLKEYKERCLIAHKHDSVKCERLEGLYTKLLLALFGTCDLDAVAQEQASINQMDSSVFSAALHPGFAGLRFSPGRVDPKRVAETQRATCLAMVAAWRHSTYIDVVVVDLSEVTLKTVGNIMVDATVTDVHTGMDLWLTIPANFKRIVIIEPQQLLGWSAIAAIGRTMATPILRDRIFFVRSKEQAAALWMPYDPTAAMPPPPSWYTLQVECAAGETADAASAAGSAPGVGPNSICDGGGSNDFPAALLSTAS